jgi:hypothetical protein
MGYWSCGFRNRTLFFTGIKYIYEAISGWIAFPPLLHSRVINFKKEWKTFSTPLQEVVINLCWKYFLILFL